MRILADASFYLSMAFYCMAAFRAVRFLWAVEDGVLDQAVRAAIKGAAFLLLTFALRWITRGRLPLTTLSDSLNLFMFLSTVVMGLVAHKSPMRSLVCFYLPSLAVIGLVNAAAQFRLHYTPRELPGLPLAVHVGLAFLAYALFFVASITSVAYVFQVQHLKRRRTTGLFHKLPSLEQLDRALYHLIRSGYPLFALTLLLGLWWAWADRELLGARWWLAPKVALALIMAAFYAVTFHMRQFGMLRGRKLAYLVFFGFAVFLATYLTLGLTNLNYYSFWGTET